MVGSTHDGTPSWELDGYSAYPPARPDTSGTGSVPQVWTQVDYSASVSLNFNGYTQGPGYYGKTFFIWPPDPRQPWLPGNDYSTQIKQFLIDFKYTAATPPTPADFSSTSVTTTLSASITTVCDFLHGSSSHITFPFSKCLQVVIS